MLGVPVLCLTGNLDRQIVPETSRFMAGQIPEGQVQALAPAGHMSVFERHKGDLRLGRGRGASRRKP
jgi:hypothetical protein